MLVEAFSLKRWNHFASISKTPVVIAVESIWLSGEIFFGCS